MADSSAIHTAAVEPRAYSSDGELLPVVDLVGRLINSDCKALRIVGEGKSTAIKHLRGCYATYSEVRFLDNGQPVQQLDDWELTVFSSPTFVRGNVELKLARWSLDDCIEYLMFKSPARCKSVMCRLMESKDLWLASGSPRIISRALDLMIEHDDIRSMESAIAAHYEAYPFKRKRHRTKIINRCLHNLLNDAQLGMDLQRYVPSYLDQDLAKFVGVQTVRYVLAAKKLIEVLEKGKTPACLAQTWTPKWIEYFADVLDREDSSSAIEFLESLANSVWSSYSSNAASVLYGLDANWLPTRQTELNYEYAQLPGLSARELILENSLITKASLQRANLPFCSLENSNVTGSDFSDANLSNCKLRLLVAKHADFSGANLQNVDACKSNFNNACLINSKMDNGDFSEASFLNADLRGASLKSAVFRKSKLSHCNFSGATFSGANFNFSNLSAANFSDVELAATCFNSCNMSKSSFEGQVLNGIVFSRCKLTSAFFSNSCLNKCSLLRSDLRNAKLGDIVWNDCDLRGVNFSNCHFHYGSTRSGLVGSPYPSHGTRTGFYTDDYDDQHYRRIEDIRKASLQGCDLTDAKVFDADFYLVDLRGATYDEHQRKHFQSCGAILND